MILRNIYTYLTLALLIMVYMIGCTDQKEANKALTAMGFTNIEYTGYNFFACSEDDWYHTGFKAKNSNGIPIKGTVCSGIFFKNSTVRFN